MTARAGRLRAVVGDLPVPEAGPEEVRRLADEVLADPAFDRPGPGLLAQARDWLFEQVGHALDRLFAAAGGGPLGWVIVAVLAAAATWLAVRLTREVQREPGAPAAAPAPRRPAADWSAEAARLEAAGEWRAGLRCRHRALVAALAALGLVSEVPGRTAGEYGAAAAAALPRVAAEVGSATSLFEAAWYGRRHVGEDEVRRFRELSDTVLAGAGQR